MKAEIGFARDDDGRLTARLVIRVSAQSTTEATLLQTFARRAGLEYDPSFGSAGMGELTIGELTDVIP